MTYHQTYHQAGRVSLAAYSDVHWRRTKMSCYRTLILLAFTTITLMSFL
jgi:hypothetical protein